MMNRHSTGRIPLLLIALVVAWGCYLRFVNLGLNTLASDEMNHYFAGESLRSTGAPLLPSGTSYTRGLEYSRMVALALPRFDRIEVAVRFPSAVIGAVCLLLFGVIAWRMAGPWPAVLATLLFTLYPEALRLSRFGRFYTLQLLGGLIAFYAGWRLLRDPLEPDRFNRRRLLEDWGWAGLILVSLGYATSVQPTTMSVAAGLGLWIAIVGIRDLRLHGSQAWRWSVPLQLTAGAGVAILLILLFRLELAREVFQVSRTVPMWARLSAEGAGAGPISAYYRRLSDNFPLVISLSPLIFLVAILRQRRLGGLLLCWFTVPILLHSVVFPWKAERYVLLAVPALFLAAGIAGAAGIAALNDYLSDRLAAWPALGERRRSLAQLASAVIVIGAVITTPAFNTSRRLVTTRQSFGWDESMALLRSQGDLAALPIGSAQPLVALHYWGRLDFTVQRALLESWRRDSTGGDFDHPFIMKAMGSPDVYAGRPTLTTAEAIRSHFAGSGAVIVGIDQKYLTHGNIDPSLRKALDTEARELCENRCGTMNLYHWPFGQILPEPAR
jgi:hypothetical protein